MYCTQCGTQHAATAAYCTQCGAMVRDGAASSTYSIDDDPTIRALLPVGRSGWALAAGYLGLFAVLTLPAPLALFCGIMGIRDIRRNPKKHGMGRCVLAVITGGLFTLLLIMFLVCIVISVLEKT